MTPEKKPPKSIHEAWEPGDTVSIPLEAFERAERMKRRAAHRQMLKDKAIDCAPWCALIGLWVVIIQC